MRVLGARSMWSQCLSAWQAGDLSTCKPLGFDLVGWAAILPVSVAALFFAIRTAAKWLPKHPDSDQIRIRLWRSRFRGLCRAIRPVMDENGRLFSEFAPNSGAAGPARV